MFTPVVAQQSPLFTHTMTEIDDDVVLHEQREYLHSFEVFERVFKQHNDYLLFTEKAAYYFVRSAFQIKHTNTELLLEKYLEEFRHTRYDTDVRLMLGEWNFQERDYPDVVRWYKTIDKDELTEEQLPKYRFQYAYGHYSNKSYDDAKSIFFRLLKDETYTTHATYYYADILYREKNYVSALNFFSTIKDDSQYSEMVAYYLSQIYFYLEKYNDAATTAKALIKIRPDHKNLIELEAIIGISNFNLSNYKAAIPFLKKFIEKTLSPSDENFYQLGYSYYKVGEYDKAIFYLSKIINRTDKLGQNAYFHLANCYLLQDKKHAAMNAYESSKEMDFDPDLKRDAYYQYAKLSYELGNPYKSVPEILKNYIRTYPDTERTEEIFRYLLNAYLTAKDFKVALDILDRTDLNTHYLKITYQKVAYLRAIELFNKEQYDLAEAMFSRSIKGGLDATLRAKTLYWLAEIHYRTQNYDKAIETFKIFQSFALSENENEYKIHYHLGHAYLKVDKYRDAVSAFLEFIRRSPDDRIRINESNLRIADAYFYNKEFELAQVYYKKSKDLEGIDADYATYQYAVCLGLNGRREERIQVLGTFVGSFRDSKFRDDALYDLANTFLQSGDNANALEYFQRVMSFYPDGEYLIRSKLKKGLIYYNLEKYEDALREFRQIVSFYPQSPQAKEAVASARRVYIDLNRVDEYVSWVEGIQFLDITKSSLDSTAYIAAEKLFFKNQTEAALSSFEKYTKDYPNGIFIINSYFYIAESYYKENNYTEALKYYRYVLERPQNLFTEKALLISAKIHTLRENYHLLIPILRRLETVASYDQNVLYAQAGLMKAYREVDSCSSAIIYGRKVMEYTALENYLKQQAIQIVARCALRTQDTAQAIATYVLLEKEGRGETVAEALHYKALFLSIDKEYEKSNAVVSELAANHAGYKYWGAKSLLVMAGNFHHLKDDYQAFYILDNVIENFGQFNDVLMEARLMKQRFELLQKNTAIQPLITPETTKPNEVVDTIATPPATPQTAKPADTLTSQVQKQQLDSLYNHPF